ncbi:aconitate hydratase [Idiomarina sp. WRN-38]|jgi:aconitate hydratase|uniref:aconitate hydratase AcnA n=1 Tax=Idiomarina sp. OXR-189 TaxID=3100175 RepID=UPI00073399D9|nr:aconitate hydratase AcnA [Idiomarina sp. OXR-189]KTG23449.1 aconitate hydratase [Idiomarina sp. H105]MCH2454216.1 aconitate hydratase AcnA [Idiomarina sp.]OAE90841.1 aconitate hydratase [Idiomarina sp. WRN-38]WPZ00430.1 aconitate hydratase AcnA [Idiomarina sp. OXR-189]|tara:strand:+ start:476 stop:3145 length:2670 start_codon:yes stop_codon:yes gene_type:complete
MSGKDSLKTLSTLEVNGKTFHYYSLPKAAEALGDISKLPASMKVLLENLLRNEDGSTVNEDDLKAMVDWQKDKKIDREIQYRPARVLMQDFTGVPGIVDLAAMRDAVDKAGHNPETINPLSPVDLVIDHSVMVDKYASPEAFKENVRIEMERNKERYEFLKWGQGAFENFRVVPPGTGICHQVNLEYLGKSVWTKEEDGKTFAFPDTLVGTDSHTTMINGIGVLGWGVGGIEAEAAMLGQPVSMLIPEVVGFRLTGKLNEGVTATDLVLTVTQMLREKGVVGKFVEFYGPGLDNLPLADRATISNMAPEYGATCGFFPVDDETLRYFRLSGRDEETIELVEKYSKAQGLWRDNDNEPEYTDSLELDLSDVTASLAGPKRPQDRVNMEQLGSNFDLILETNGQSAEKDKEVPVKGKDYSLSHGDVVIAAITSCTNTSNPSVMMAAGLLAQKAIEKGLMRKPWVKSSLAPGSKVVTDYLAKAGLDEYLDKLGFNLVGYGCTTCIGNSGPLDDEITEAIQEGDLTVSSVLSGNRNFEGRVHPEVKANWLASPPLVVAYALAGTTRTDLTKDPIGKDKDGNDVFLKDIWPSSAEISEAVKMVDNQMFGKEYAEVFAGDEEWQRISVAEGKTYNWQDESTYVKNPPFFEGIDKPLEDPSDIKDANVLAVFADSITTDHISPAGSIKPDSPAGKYLQENGVAVKDFNSYGSRRGNHEVMMRGTFANIRIKNQMLDNVEGGFTKFIPTGEQMPIYDAAMKYMENDTPLVVLAGKEYGTGSSRDWAAKGTRLLGVKAVIAESYERIHRSNLVGMGVLPLQFVDGQGVEAHKLTGEEQISVLGLNGDLKPGQMLDVVAKRKDGSEEKFQVKCRIDTGNEMNYYKNGGILHYVLRQMLK